MANRVHDWAAIRADYVASRDSLDVVRARHKVDHASIGRHCAAGGWVLEREEFQRRVADQRLALNVRQQARAEAEIDRAVHAAAWAAVGVLTESLAQAKEPATVKTCLEALEKAYRLLRVTAELPAEKVVEPVKPERDDAMVVGVDAAGVDFVEVPDGRRFRPEVEVFGLEVGEATVTEAPLGGSSARSDGGVGVGGGG